MKLHLETTNSYGLTLRGYASTPELNGNKFPTVIMFHGFTGNKVEHNFLFARAANALEKEGYCVIRFDFSHSGESDGDFVNMTPTGEIQDALDIVAFTSRLPFVDEYKITLLGFSMGGYVAAAVAAQLQNRVKGLILWSPAGNLKDIFATYFGKTPGTEVIDIDGLELSRSAYTDVCNIDIYNLAKGYRGKVLIVHALDDDIVPFEFGLQFKRIYGDQATLLTLEAGGHTLQSSLIAKCVFTETVKFLKNII